jgi:hypothetical protein
MKKLTYDGVDYLYAEEYYEGFGFVTHIYSSTETEKKKVFGYSRNNYQNIFLTFMKI